MGEDAQMKTQIKIRPIHANDAELVAELVTQLGYERTPEQVRHWVHGLDSRRDQACFVAELNAEVVAWIDVSLEHHLQSEVFGLIGGLVVRDGLRNAGIGRRLCEQAEVWTRQQGATKIRVTSPVQDLDGVREGASTLKHADPASPVGGIRYHASRDPCEQPAPSPLCAERPDDVAALHGAVPRHRNPR